MGDTVLTLPVMNFEHGAGYYRQKAMEMRSHAVRAESPLLGEIYRTMAEEWEFQAEHVGDDALDGREGASVEKDVLIQKGMVRVAR